MAGDGWREIELRLMTAGDMPLGMRLVKQAGWNQLETDWRRFLALEPDGCFVALCSGAAVGTVTTCRFGPVGWIGMLLVDEGHRGRGVGKALLAGAVDWLARDAAAGVRLDATPEGRPLYERMGFEAQFALARYGGVSQAGDTAAEVQLLDETLAAQVFAIDRQISGADRRKLLERLFAEQPGEVYVAPASEGGVAGYQAMRPGRLATHIGPCVALERAAGEALLSAALTRCRGRHVFVDVALDNPAAVQIVEAAGLEPLRHFTRMTRMLRPAAAAPVERIDHLWASSGPEKG